MWFDRKKVITESDVATAVKSAVADAATASLLAAHMAECDRFKVSVERGFKEQNADRERMHAENSIKFDRIHRTIYYASGAVAGLVTLYSTQLGDLLKKLLH